MSEHFVLVHIILLLRKAFGSLPSPPDRTFLYLKECPGQLQSADKPKENLCPTLSHAGSHPNNYLHQNSCKRAAHEISLVPVSKSILE